MYSSERYLLLFSYSFNIYQPVVFQGTTEEIKQLTGYISKLKNEIGTNKTLKAMRLLPNGTDDAEEWNNYMIKRTDIEGGTPTWYNTPWLYCECYMYRVLAQEIALM